MTPIKYIGHRDEYTDGCYATHIHWKQGETQMVPDAKAVLMLRHTDVYVRGEGVMNPDPEGTRDKAAEDDQDVRDSIATMDKDALATFAKTHFSVELDKRQRADTLRQRVTTMFDQYGIG